MVKESDKTLQELFKLANKVGNRRYHKLTQQDFDDYRSFDHWRYINGDSECGTTDKSRSWVRDNLSPSYLDEGLLAQRLPAVAAIWAW